MRGNDNLRKHQQSACNIIGYDIIGQIRIDIGILALINIQCYRMEFAVF